MPSHIDHTPARPTTQNVQPLRSAAAPCGPSPRHASHSEASQDVLQVQRGGSMHVSSATDMFPAGRVGTQHRPAAPSWLSGGVVGVIAGGGVATGVVTTALYAGGPVGWGILAGVSALATTLVVWGTVHLVQKRAHDEGYAAGFVARGNADDFFADAGIPRPTFLPAEHHSVHVDIEAPAPAVSEAGAPRGGNIERPAPVSPDAGLHAFYALAQREAEMDAAFALCAEPQNAYLKTLDEEVDDLLRDRAGFSLPR